MENNSLVLNTDAKKSIAFSNEVVEKVLSYARKGLEGSVNTQRA